MKSVIEETEIIRSKYVGDIKVSYITNGHHCYIKVSTSNEDKTDIGLIYESLKTKLVKKNDELFLELDSIDYNDCPDYYMSKEVEAVFLGLYNLIKDNIDKLRETLQTSEGVQGSSL